MELEIEMPDLENETIELKLTKEEAGLLLSNIQLRMTQLAVENPIVEDSRLDRFNILSSIKDQLENQMKESKNA